MSSGITLTLISFLSVLVLASILFIYKYIFPKKRISLFALLVLISLLPLVSLLRPGTFESGDFTFHVIESMVFYRSLAQGIVFPIWAGDMNNTYGYPAFLFIYPLPFYISSIFHSIGFSFLNSMKLVLAVSFVASGAFMFLWLKKKINETGAFVGALFYLFAPYHLIDLHFRVAVGEIVALAFLPIVLYSFEKFVTGKKYRWLFIQAFAIGFLILSHPAISLSGLAMIAIYILYSIYFMENRKVKLRMFLNQAAVFVLGAGLASFYLIPLIYDSRFTQLVHVKNVTFTSIPHLLYSPWLGGFLFQGPHGELDRMIIGYAQIFVVFLSILFLVKGRFNKQNKRMLLIFLFITFVSLFMIIEASSFVWKTAPLIKNLQFSYRFLGVSIFATSVVAAIVATNLNKRWVIALCLFVVLSTILNWGNRRNLPNIKDQELAKQELFITREGGGFSQAITFWSDPKNPWAQNIPRKHLEIINGTGNIKEIKRTITKHLYLIDAKTDLTLRENTLYFPGWIVLINKKNQSIKILTEGNPKGIISFNVSKGINLVELKFIDNYPRKIGKIISIISFILLLLFIFFNLKFFKTNKHRNKKVK